MFPAWLVVTVPVVLAFPIGWGLGVALAYALVSGSNIGVLPALTIPVSTAAAIVFALWPSIPPLQRLTIMAIAATGLTAVSLLTRDKPGRGVASNRRTKPAALCRLTKRLAKNPINGLAGPHMRGTGNGSRQSVTPQHIRPVLSFSAA